jgi:hypothetical protein
VRNTHVKQSLAYKPIEKQNPKHKHKATQENRKKFSQLILRVKEEREKNKEIGTRPD